jgi:hypothetical protein
MNNPNPSVKTDGKEYCAKLADNYIQSVIPCRHIYVTDLRNL